ncbi:Hypothetical protein PHPALM_21271 [Phytophthora palmivora]|uniref:Transmembrane protein n=1 Tax=Phytophthora palmivora TaxID=4796 RepID=A0A2P4XCT6_9STRA|nr:Hypothetical protein PHPALM_21271 [Phytophthora palmivora]
MAAVSPTSSDIECSQNRGCSFLRLAKHLTRWFRQIFGRLPGEYTVAKLDTFERFLCQTAHTQVAAILLLTPMSSILVNTFIEIIPLNDPATPLHRCIGFLLRNFVTATIVTMAPFWIKPDCIPQLPIQSWKLALGFGILLGTVSTGTIAALIYVVNDFPIPSSQFSPMIPMAIVGRLIEFRLLQKPEVKQRLEKVDMWLGMVVVPILIYPITTAIFMALGPSYQLWFSLLLPVIKHLLRYLLWLAAKDDLDLVGSIVCTIGHFYHVLFTAMCLQNAKNEETLIAVFVVNFIHMLMNCREIVQGANKINRAKFQLKDLSSTEDIISTALRIAQKMRVARSLHRKHPSRFVSQYPRYQYFDFITRHHRLLAQPFLGPTEADDSMEQQTTNARQNSTKTSIYPVKPEADTVITQTLPTMRDTNSKALDTRLGSNTTTRTRSQHAYRSCASDDSRLEENFVRSLTSTLYQTEFILLRSYITMFGLSFYGFYLMLVFWLSNSQYFATMANITTFDDMTNMVFYLLLLCSTEFLFFAIYLAIIQRYVGISGIYQLAFVLWSQRVLIQGKLVMLSVMILGFPLKHYGNDFIFHLRPHA